MRESMRKQFNPSTACTGIPNPSLRLDPNHDSRSRELLVDQLPAIIWTTNRELQITSYGGLPFGSGDRRPEEFIGMTLNDYFGEGNTAVLYISEHHQVLRGVPLAFDADYNGRAFRVRVSPLLDEQSIVIGTIGVALDVTDRKASEESIRYLATHDPLTDLANYRALLSSFDTELQRSDRTGRPFTALLLDVDGLKAINDRHGHLIGSKALCRLANVLKRTCRSIDTVARYGGDEFAILLVETNELAARVVAKRIKDGLAADQENPSITASVGIAVYPRDGYTVENLLARADQMLYRNKLRLTLHKQADNFQTRYDAVGPPGVERRRSKRFLLDVSVVVRGESVDGQTFQEETFTISVSAHGALLMLGPKVALGQTLLVRNQLTNIEKPARVAHCAVPYGGIARVGVEFPEPAAEFWSSDVPSKGLRSSSD
jgi:diguanylate cyclase (GGDEF)-like protein